MLTPAIFQEMGRIRARSLRDDARGGAGRDGLSDVVVWFDTPSGRDW